MTDFVQTRLVNDPFGDPGLLFDFRDRKAAILFDLGDLGPLSAAELLRVERVFVSHLHLDHFVGFDRLLRVNLLRAGTLQIAGPRGLIDAVEAKLTAYAWNLLGPKSPDFAILASEIDEDGIVRSCRFREREAFRRSAADAPQPTAPTVLDEPTFAIESTVLDHGIPCLAFALQEKPRLSVRTEGLAARGLSPGPWLQAVKAAIRRGDADGTTVDVGPDRALRLGEVRAQLIETVPGQRVAYVVDTAFTEANIDRILRLAEGADDLYIEAAFLDEDRAIAARKRHLCAGQAGDLARRAHVRRVTPLHYSQRYVGRSAELARQVQDAFAGVPTSATEL